MAKERTKAERRADREAVGSYHEAELAKLLERVRSEFASYDAGTIDAFELDDLIHHYKRAAQKLWSACTGSAGDTERMARTLKWQAEHGETTDWWDLGAPRRPMTTHD